MMRGQILQWNDKLQVGKVIVVESGRVINSEKQYTTIKHDLALLFTSDTKIHDCEEDRSIPHCSFNFTSL